MQDYRSFYCVDVWCGLRRYYWLKPRIRFTIPLMDSLSPAFAAGIAPKSLDDLTLADPPWLGCWRDRLALKSAAVAVKKVGRN